MSRHVQRIPTERGTFVMASGVDPPTAMMFVQLWAPAKPEDEVPGGPGPEPDGTFLVIDHDCHTVDELEKVMTEQKFLPLEEAFAAFGTPWPEDEKQRRWYNDRGRALLEAEQRSLLEPPKEDNG